MSLMLMPAKEGTCEFCAVDHIPETAHNQQSLFYQYQFYGRFGRWPTWADAIAHLEPELKAQWTEALRERNVWPESYPDAIPQVRGQEG